MYVSDIRIHMKKKVNNQLLRIDMEEKYAAPLIENLSELVETFGEDTVATSILCGDVCTPITCHANFSPHLSFPLSSGWETL